MNMQLDATGGQYLARKMEQMGVRVLTSRKTERLLGNGHVQGVAFAGGEEVPAEDRRGRRRHPAQRGTRAQGRAHRESRHRGQRSHGDQRPAHLRGGRMRRASRAGVRPGRAAVRTGQGAGRHHHRQQGSGVPGLEAGRQAEDHGRRCLLGGRVRGEPKAPKWSATKTPRWASTRSCWCATTAWPAWCWWAMRRTAIATWNGCATIPTSPCAAAICCSRSRSRTAANRSPRWKIR